MFSFYPIIKIILSFLHHLFYRDISILNGGHLPADEPTIIFSNHNNFYIDASILIQGIERQVTMMVASVAWKNKIIKRFLDRIDTIPIDRAKDFSRKGKGKIICVKEKEIMGKGTNFDHLKEGQAVYFEKKQFKVKSILSNNHILISNPTSHSFLGESDYKIYPKINRQRQNKIIHEHLLNNKLISIFPEGVTHDNLSLLPFKMGICVTAFEMMEKYDKRINLVPAGIIYHNHHVSRSKVCVNLGQSVKIQENLWQIYKKNKNQGLALLKNQLQNSLSNVLIETTQFNSIQPIIACRKLYYSNTYLSESQKIKMAQIFAKSFEQLKGDNQTNHLKEKLIQYCKVKQNLTYARHFSQKNLLQNVLQILLGFALSFVLLIPGLILFQPLLLVVRKKVQKTRQTEAKASEYRINGHDVIATYTFLHGIHVFTKAFCVISLVCWYFYGFTFLQHLLFCAMFLLICVLYGVCYVRIWDRMVEEGKKLKALFSWMWYSEGEEQELKNETCQMIKKMVYRHPELFSTLK